MILLIDYDNLPRRLMEANLRSVIEILLAKLDFSSQAPINRIFCRLYGGWLKGKSLSFRAQRLIEQINVNFPLVLSPTDHTNAVVSAELARALACDPQHDFTHTFRLRSKPEFSVRRFPLRECVEPLNCRIKDVNSFVYKNLCPRENCSVTPETAFYRAEQKLVDSMIVVDLVHYAIHHQEHLVLVSGDDDMWPGIRYALLQRAVITHVIPKHPHHWRNPYKRLSTQNYNLITL